MQTNNMKKQIIVLTIAMGTLTLLSSEIFAQEPSGSDIIKVERMDSTEMASRDELRARETRNANTISDYRDNRKETKAKAKEARRVESEANTAARESRYALRAEKRAQKTRKNADKQAEKAARARTKSDRN